MADESLWIRRMVAAGSQTADSSLDILQIDNLPPAHAGSYASPYLAGQFSRWVKQGDNHPAHQSEETLQTRLLFQLDDNSNLGDRIIACFANRPGEVLIGLPPSTK